MGMLEIIRTGREAKPPRIMIYGSEGVGNSTFAASAPNPIFIQTEDGLGEINCRKFPLANSLSEVLAELAALRDEPHEYLTVVIDSADWLERLIFDEVCKEFGVRSIEKADGGYGKGYTHALTHWRKVVNLLQELRDKRGMVVILVAHAKVERFEDPDHLTFAESALYLASRNNNNRTTEWTTNWTTPQGKCVSWQQKSRISSSVTASAGFCHKPSMNLIN